VLLQLLRLLASFVIQILLPLWLLARAMPGPGAPFAGTASRVGVGLPVRLDLVRLVRPDELVGSVEEVENTSLCFMEEKFCPSPDLWRTARVPSLEVSGRPIPWVVPLFPEVVELPLLLLVGQPLVCLPGCLAWRFRSTTRVGFVVGCRTAFPAVMARVCVGLAEISLRPMVPGGLPAASFAPACLGPLSRLDTFRCPRGRWSGLGWLASPAPAP
jgi:hypothetical protein